MNILQVVVMAVVEGVTEFLPISSTGHMILAASLMKIVQSEFVKSFEIIIQLGAIMAVVWEFRSKLIKDIKLIEKLGVAFIPTGIVGFFLYKLIKHFLIGNLWVTVGALAGGGLLMIIWEKFLISNSKITNKKLIDLSIKQCLVIGLCQAVSVIPGVSRALATIIGGMGVGLSRQEATEFSFLLAVPTMVAATGLDVIKSGWGFGVGEWVMLGVGCAVAFVTALISVRWLVKYVKNHSLSVFGVYRVVIAGLFLLV